MTVRLPAALACALAGFVLASAAHAQDRDLKAWGGPPHMGMDYKTGQSYGVSDFGAAKPAAPKKRRVVRARGTTRPTKETATALKKPPLPEPNPARLAIGRPGTVTAATAAASETATDASPVETGTLAPAVDTGPIPCRKYDPMTGRTIEIRCR